MPNIAITSYCNLHCPYCFAQQMMKDQTINNITIEQFDKILEWISPWVKETHSRTGILGGEPTLHPQFEELMEHFSKFLYEHQSLGMLYTNGINLTPDLIKTFPANLWVLINYNYPTTMTEKQWNQLQYNIDFIQSIGWITDKVAFALTMSPDIPDYQFFKDIIKKTGVKKIRIAVDRTNKWNNKEYYSIIKKDFLDIIQFAIDYQLESVLLDCHIPIQYFTNEEKELIFKIIPEEVYNAPCNPIYEIFPDFTMSKCFAHYDLINCNNYKDFKEYKEGLTYADQFCLSHNGIVSN